MTWELNGGMPGVIFTHGKYWKELRRFMLRNLRDLGFGKTSMEDLFHVEVSKLCNLLAQSSGKNHVKTSYLTCDGQNDYKVRLI